MITYRDYTEAEMENFYTEWTDALPVEVDKDDPTTMEDFRDWLDQIDHGDDV